MKHKHPLGFRVYKFTTAPVRLNQKDIEQLEAVGIIPVQKELGETTRLVNVRVDTRNLNKLRILQARFKAKDKNLTLSEIHRLALIRGIKQMMQETLESNP